MNIILISGPPNLNLEVMDVNERIRARVRQEMTRQGLTQHELARRLGVKQPSIAQLLSGKRGTMPESLLDLLGALGLTLEAVPVKDLEPLPEPEPSKRGRPRSASSAEGKERQDPEQLEQDPAATSPEQDAEAEA